MIKYDPNKYYVKVKLLVNILLFFASIFGGDNVAINA